MWVLTPVALQRQPCQGHCTSSPQTLPPWPRWAPKWGQKADRTWARPLSPRKRTRSSEKYRKAFTSPQARLADQSTWYHPVGCTSNGQSFICSPRRLTNWLVDDCEHGSPRLSSEKASDQALSRIPERCEASSRKASDLLGGGMVAGS